VTWTKLDDSFYDDPKILIVGNEAAGVFVRMLSYCGRHLTDGLVPEQAARFISPRIKPLRALVEAGLVREVGKDYGVVGFLDFNPCREEVEERRRVRAEAGRRGGLAKARASAKANGKGGG
jgi:hypothetical protein